MRVGEADTALDIRGKRGRMKMAANNLQWHFCTHTTGPHTAQITEEEKRIWKSGFGGGGSGGGSHVDYPTQRTRQNRCISLIKMLQCHWRKRKIEKKRPDRDICCCAERQKRGGGGGVRDGLLIRDASPLRKRGEGGQKRTSEFGHEMDCPNIVVSDLDPPATTNTRLPYIPVAEEFV